MFFYCKKLILEYSNPMIATTIMQGVEGSGGCQKSEFSMRLAMEVYGMGRERKMESKDEAAPFIAPRRFGLRRCNCSSTCHMRTTIFALEGTILVSGLALRGLLLPPDLRNQLERKWLIRAK